jgi:hypothetical protein
VVRGMTLFDNRSPRIVGSVSSTARLGSHHSEMAAAEVRASLPNTFFAHRRTPSSRAPADRPRHRAAKRKALFIITCLVCAKPNR